MAPEATTARDFTCRVCGQQKLFYYDWQRCYDCMLLSVPRDYQATPTVCKDCCRKNHRPNFDTKQR